MQTKVQKWGNSLALRIPKAFASEIGLDNEVPVDLRLENGKLIISRIEQTPFSLEQLLAGVTEQNVHGEQYTGPATGNELW